MNGLQFARRTRDEYTEETGEKYTLDMAWDVIEERCRSFTARWEGESVQYAVSQDRDIAEYMLSFTKGERRQALKAEITAHDERMEQARAAAAAPVQKTRKPRAPRKPRTPKAA